MNHINADKYLHRKRNRNKLYFRLRLGLQQLVLRPYNMAVPILLIFLLTKLWQLKWKFLPYKAIPLSLLPIYQYIISFGTVLIPLVFLLGFLHFLGEITARQDESNLIVAFTEKDLRNGHPILVSRKKFQGDVTIREFYTNIPLKIWVARKEEISDIMNIHFVTEIEYGGKKRDNGNRIILYTAPTRKRIDRGQLYDSEL